MKQVNLFCSKVFVTSVGFVAVNFIKPALEDYIKSNCIFNIEKHGLPVFYSLSSLFYMSWLRQASDDEGVSYTPKYILGRNKDEENT